MSAAPASADPFHYDGYDVDPQTGRLACRYSVGSRQFVEELRLGPGGDWGSPGVGPAARLVFLLAGVSYYKTAAPSVIDLGAFPLSPAEHDLLRLFYREGLAEFSYRNHLDLSDLRIEAGRSDPLPVPLGAAGVDHPLVPFGGGIDSIVTVESVKARHPRAALFVVSHAGSRFEAIEAAASATGLPCVRAERAVDPQVLRSAELGFLNGHVPVTGIISAVAVLAAVLHGHDAVVMSNERSADVGSHLPSGHTVNHQFSKSLEFEEALRRVLEETFEPPVAYFSLLRPHSELWVASRFAALERYHPVFRSCNRAFAIDPSRRLDQWCGRCDKCCFIDLVLAPFLGADELDGIFGGHEPLRDASLAGQFRALLGAESTSKPFECVGEVDECRTALRLAARRADRQGNLLLLSLVDELPDELPDVDLATERLLTPHGQHHVPDAFTTDHLLV